MNFTSLSYGEVLAFIVALLTGIGGYFNLRNTVKNNSESLKELEQRLEKTETRTTTHEREVGVMNANLSTIKSEIQGVAARLDTIYLHLLKKEKE